MTLTQQPDDPGMCVCPRCGSTYKPNPDADALRLAKANAGKVPEAEIARAACVSLNRLRRIAASAKPPIDLTLKKEAEARGG